MYSNTELGGVTDAPVAALQYRDISEHPIGTDAAEESRQRRRRKG